MQWWNAKNEHGLEVPKDRLLRKESREISLECIYTVYNLN